MKLEFTRAAEKTLDRVPTHRRRQIIVRIKAPAADPMTRQLDVKPLAGSDLSRLRVGQYRILFSVDVTTEVLTVQLIRTRGDVYKR
jgi:mRNA interferase RelE/StbE